MNPHERGFLAFLAEPGRDRMKRLLEMGERRRRDASDLLHDAVRLDPRYSTHLVGSDDFAPRIEQWLRERGAPGNCYLFSALADLDGREMPLIEALDATSWGDFGVFISCLPGRLGFFRYASPKSAYLLYRPGGS
jgi:hypothetical protein